MRSRRLAALVAAPAAVAAILLGAEASAADQVAALGLGGPESGRAARIAGLAAQELEARGYEVVEPDRAAASAVQLRRRPDQARLQELMQGLGVAFAVTVGVSREVKDGKRYLRARLMLVDRQGLSLTAEEQIPLEEFDARTGDLAARAASLLAETAARGEIEFPAEIPHAMGALGAAFGAQTLTYAWVFGLAWAHRECSSCIMAGMAAYFAAAPAVTTSLAWHVADRARYHTAPYVPMLVGAYLGAGLGYLSVHAVLAGWTDNGASALDTFLTTIPPILAPPLLMFGAYLLFRDLRPEHGTGPVATRDRRQRVAWYPPVPSPLVSMDGSGVVAHGLTAIRLSF